MKLQALNNRIEALRCEYDKKRNAIYAGNGLFGMWDFSVEERERMIADLERLARRIAFRREQLA